MRHTARRAALGWCGRLGRAAGIAGLAVAMTGPAAAASTPAPSAGSSYQELYRPQFHYTQAKTAATAAGANAEQVCGRPLIRGGRRLPTNPNVPVTSPIPQSGVLPRGALAHRPAAGRDHNPHQRVSLRRIRRSQAYRHRCEQLGPARAASVRTPPPSPPR